MKKRRATPPKPGLYARITLFDESGKIYQCDKKPMNKAQDDINEFLDMKLNSTEKILLKGGEL